MSKHDLLCSELQVSSILPNKVGFITVGKPLRYTTIDVYDDYDLVPLWKVREMLDSVGTKTVLNVPDGDKVINWQTDIVPGDDRTYADKHGDSIAAMQGHYDAGSGTMTPYNPNYTYTLNNDGTINVLTLTEVFAGTITII